MSKFVDLTNQRFGRLTVISRAENAKRLQTQWNCMCDCGKETIIRAANLKNGTTKSCGCLQVDINKKLRTTHGKTNSDLYKVWQAMKGRTERQSDKAYKNYGGRGIFVCDEWKNDFQSFYNWATQNGYKKGLTIDRINNNDGYSPDNCRWTTSKEQNNNRRDNKYLKYDNKTMTVAEWAGALGINNGILRNRLHRGWTIKDVLTNPVKNISILYTHDNKTMTLTEWADVLGIKRKTLERRLHRGWTIKDALTKPVKK